MSNQPKVLSRTHIGSKRELAEAVAQLPPAGLGIQHGLE